jgi:hypothetical protein
VTRFGFVRRPGSLFIFRLFLGFSSSTMPWLDLSFGIAHLSGTNAGTRRPVRSEPSGFFRVFHASQTSPARDISGGCFMEAVYFIGAFLLLIALIYGTLNWHYRDKRKDRITDQVVRDRYEHNRT